MGISVFPTGGGEFVINDFVIDMNDTTNNTAELSSTKEAGSYTVSLSSGDSSFDIYALDADGALVGYTNNASLVTTEGFTTVVVLGVSQTEVLTFSFAGAVSSATAAGQEIAAGAYLTSISPNVLPTVDDTANIVGGNFANDIEIYFESGTVSTAAKNIVRTDSTALVVTRPDSLDAALDPWDVKAINPGVTPPTGSNAHILAGTVDAGQVPAFQTTSPLTAGTINSAYAGTIVATDSDGDVTYSITSGTLPAGISLNAATGVLSGTPTAGGSTFTVEALDDGGNASTRQFELPVMPAIGGSVSTVGNYTVHTFNSTGNFEALTTINNVEYIILGGGGGGATGENANNLGGGGGGGGGLLSSISGFASGSATTALSPVTVNAGTITVTVGAGGSGRSNVNSRGGSGSDSAFGTFGTALGGGGGASQNTNGGNGGSGGGGFTTSGNAGSGTSGQGFEGGANAGFNAIAGGGGGTSSEGLTTNSDITPSDGGDGTSNFLDERGWGAGGGTGLGSDSNLNIASGGGSDGNDQTNYAGDGGANNTQLAGDSGDANFGGGGGGGGGGSGNSDGGSGGSGKVVVRYEL